MLQTLIEANGNESHVQKYERDSVCVCVCVCGSNAAKEHESNPRGVHVFCSWLCVVYGSDFAWMISYHGFKHRFAVVWKTRVLINAHTSGTRHKQPCIVCLCVGDE